MTAREDAEADAGNVFFSEWFDVVPQTPEDYGALDISLVSDLPMFIDPFLLFNSAKEDYQALHETIIEYLRFLKFHAGERLSPGLIKAWYSFAEVKQNWLGFVQDGDSGHRLGRKFAIDLNEALTSLLSDFGEEVATESTHVEKVALIRPGVGRDTISDFTTNLIKHYLCAYTESFALEHIAPEQRREFAVPRAVFNYSTKVWMPRTYTLPALDGDFVLLTPLDMLTMDDTFIKPHRHGWFLRQHRRRRGRRRAARYRFAVPDRALDREPEAKRGPRGARDGAAGVSMDGRPVHQAQGERPGGGDREREGQDR